MNTTKAPVFVGDVLIVAKCNVNFFTVSLVPFFTEVLIVAKCNVNILFSNKLISQLPY